MGIIKEFKEFAVKGNMVDMAVGIIIGGAFGKIVTSLVTDVIMPPIGLLLGGVDFKKFAWPLREATADEEALVLNIGSFLQVFVDFVIVAFCVFLLVKGINRLKSLQAKEVAAAPPPAPPRNELLLEEIRDLLAKR